MNTWLLRANNVLYSQYPLIDYNVKKFSYKEHGATMSTFLCVKLLVVSGTHCRVPTRPGKPGKMRVHLENLEISWNFEKFNKYHGKMT